MKYCTCGLNGVPFPKHTPSCDIYDHKNNPFIAPERLTSLKWAAVDFDGCVAESKWTPENPTYEAGLPVEGALEKTLELVDAGFQITIHTARPWSDYSYVEAWLIHYGFPFRRIIMGKLLAHMYVDDRAVNSREKSWLL